MSDRDFVQIGEEMYYGSTEPFGLAAEERRRHLYILGKSGTGKSSVIRNLFIQDVEAGRGVSLIDPHGDLAEELLDYIPPYRADDLVYFSPSDRERPIGFNPLYNVREEERPLVAGAIVGTFKSIWRDSWGPRLEHILYQSVAALLEYGDSTLLGINRLLTHEAFRERVVRSIKDPHLLAFWVDEFGAYDKRFLVEAIAPIQNKVGQLLASPILRNILGQVRSTIDLGFMMDDRRILLANLSKGKTGEHHASLIGSLLISGFQAAALRRAEIPEEEREDHHLLVDEFHSFVTESFVGLLSEARKYRLCLCLAHQYIDQMTPEIRHAVLGNVGTIIAFEVGPRDAVVLEKELSPYSREHFSELGEYEVLVKTLGRIEAFRGKTLAPLGRRYGGGEKLRARSREKYGRPRQEIEAKIGRWMTPKKGRPGERH